MADEFDFDNLQPIEISVKHGGKKYLLCEVTEAGARVFRSAASKVTKISDSGEITHLDGAGNLPSLLLSLCLCETDENGKVKRDEQGFAVTVPQATLLTWKSRFVQPLFDKARTISGLAPDKETEASLSKRIADAQERLEALRAKNAAGASTESTSP